jgi:tRNA (guanine26-N2/guanine27-N2)-dimethyltransferase
MHRVLNLDFLSSSFLPARLRLRQQLFCSAHRSMSDTTSNTTTTTTTTTSTTRQPSSAEERALAHARKQQLRAETAKKTNSGLGDATPTFPVEFEGVQYRAIRENTATALFRDQNAVFYNPVQETNRDLSVAGIKAFIALRRAELAADRAAAAAAAAEQEAKGKRPRVRAAVPADLAPLRLLEALSATGLRSIRYAKEIEGLGEIVANDIDEAAVAAIRRNLRFNDVPTTAAPASAFVTPSHGDAIDVMFSCRNKPARQYDIVDLDPYGSAAPFLDSAMQAIKDGGMMLVTCTDLAVLGGNQQAVCYTKYGGAPIKSAFTHEQALRIVLQTLSRVAAQHKRTIEPLMSLSIDFYVRIMVRVRDAPNEALRVYNLHSLLYQCVGCDAFSLQDLGTVGTDNNPAASKPSRGPPVAATCEHCGSRHSVGGPVWNGPLHNQAFATGVADELTANASKYGAQKKALSLAGTAMNELQTVGGYQLPQLLATLRIESIKDAAIHSAIMQLGYQVSHSHSSPKLMKTTAPTSVVFDVMRCLAKLRPPKRQMANTPGATILAKEPSITADFTIRREALELRNTRPTLVHNPSFWGPKRRATGHDEAPRKRGRGHVDSTAAAEASTSTKHDDQ